MSNEILDLIKAEGWTVTWKGKEQVVLVQGTEYPIAHPFAIYSKIYREDPNPEIKYQALRRMHDLLWPKQVDTWNYWDERK